MPEGQACMGFFPTISFFTFWGQLRHVVLICLPLLLLDSLIDPNQCLLGNVLTIVHTWAGTAAGDLGGWHVSGSRSTWPQPSGHLRSPVSKPDQKSKPFLVPTGATAHAATQLQSSPCHPRIPHLEQAQHKPP